MLPNLTPKEKQVYLFIKDFIKSRGIPPTNREIAEHFNIAPKNAFKYLSILEKKGYIKKEKKISRGISITDNTDNQLDNSIKKIPFISYVSAGFPIDIDTVAEDYDYYVFDSKIFPYSNVFMFKVIGDSMINANITDGDLAVIATNVNIEPNDIVVASIYNEITLKRFIKKGDISILHPENEKYEDIVLNDINPDEIKIIGKIVGIIRKI